MTLFHRHKHIIHILKQQKSIGILIMMLLLRWLLGVVDVDVVAAAVVVVT